MASCSLISFTLRESLAAVNRPCTESCRFQLYEVFNPDKGSIESRDYLGPVKTCGTEVKNEAMMANFLAAGCTLDSITSLI